MERRVVDMEYPTSTDLAATIKAAMKSKKLSQRELAEVTCIPQSTLHRRLNGSAPTWDELTAIAEAVGRTASSLIAETEVRVAASSEAA